MTPLEKAKAEEGRVNYCDECEQFTILNNAMYCRADGKLIHPIMIMRGQGTGPAWNCIKRKKPITNYECVVSKSPEELAMWINSIIKEKNIEVTSDGWLEWLKEEVSK